MTCRRNPIAPKYFPSKTGTGPVVFLFDCYDMDRGPLLNTMKLSLIPFHSVRAFRSFVPDHTQMTKIVRMGGSFTRATLAFTALITVWGGPAFVGRAQDPEFSQFYANPAHGNPAFAGITYRPKIHTTFRDQWPSIPHAYLSFLVSYDQFIEPLNSGIGAMIMADQAGGGIYNTYVGGLLYSYQVNFSDFLAVKVGVQGNMIHKKLDATKLVYYDQLDPVQGQNDPGNNPYPTAELLPEAESLTYADLSAGLLIFRENLYAGASVKHINRPYETFTNEFTSRLPMRFLAHAGFVFSLSDAYLGEATLLSPNVLFTQQGSFRQLNLGAFVKNSWVFGGAWLRHHFDYMDAVILMAGVQYEFLKIAYSYDITVKRLSAHSGGAHEVTMVLNFDDQPFLRKRMGKDLRCPSIYL